MAWYHNQCSDLLTNWMDMCIGAAAADAYQLADDAGHVYRVEQSCFFTVAADAVQSFSITLKVK